jgi:hypothetical protein
MREVLWFITCWLSFVCVAFAAMFTMFDLLARPPQPFGAIEPALKFAAVLALLGIATRPK